MIAALLLVNTTYASDKIGLHIHDPWIKEAPPNATVLGAYMTIENHENKKFIITQITSPLFKKVEIHKSVTKDGMTTMEQRKRIVIHANKSFILQPGDYHLMLIKPTKPLKHGDLVPLTFTLENGKTIIAKAKVKKVLGSMSAEKGVKSASDNDHKHQHSH
jgi:copper(I)-binding protein